MLGGLSSTFEGMMEALSDENEEDRYLSFAMCKMLRAKSSIFTETSLCRETAGWDVKLATEFKSLQRKIISSILASCDSGCKMLESELCKQRV